MNGGLKTVANKGRLGDNKLAPVDGKPAHVSASEQNLIEKYGPIGESIVKQIGSGTINPKTGLKEYHIAWSHVEDVADDVGTGLVDLYDDTIGVNGIAGYTGQILDGDISPGDFWDDTLGVDGIVGAFTDGDVSEFYDDTIGVGGLGEIGNDYIIEPFVDEFGNTFIGDIGEGVGNVVGGFAEGIAGLVGYDTEASNWVWNDEGFLTEYGANNWNQWLGVDGFASGWDDFWGWAGTGGNTNIFSSQETQEYTDEQEGIAAQRGYMSEGIEGLSNQYNFNMGPDGAISQGANLGRGLTSLDYIEKHKTAAVGDDLIRTKGDFSGMGTGYDPNALRDKYQLTAKQSYLAEAQSRSDLTANMQKELNTMLIGYEQATDESYSGQDLADLQHLINPQT